MAKKDLLNKMQSGLGSMLQQTATQEPTAEQMLEDEAVLMAAEAAAMAQPEGAGHNAGKNYRKTGKASTLGLREGETRYTIILKEETLAKVKEMAYLQRKTIRAAVEAAIEVAVAEYEKKNGVIVPFKEKED